MTRKVGAGLAWGIAGTVLADVPRSRRRLADRRLHGRRQRCCIRSACLSCRWRGGPGAAAQGRV